MKKRIAIIRKGTAGTPSIIHSQSAGQESTVTLPANLCNNLNFNYIDLDKIDTTIKVGIYRSGWGKNGTIFLHDL